MPLPGTDEADVWLRKNITAPEENAEDSCWVADEVYFRTALSLDAVEDNFDALFSRSGIKESTLEERIAVLEQELTDAQLALCQLYETLEV